MTSQRTAPTATTRHACHSAKQGVGSAALQVAYEHCRCCRTAARRCISNDKPCDEPVSQMLVCGDAQEHF